MDIGLALIILGEIAFTLFIVWGFCHEQRFIDFEDRVIEAVKVRRRNAAKAKVAAHRAKLNEKVYYTPVMPEKKRKNSCVEAA